MPLTVAFFGITRDIVGRSELQITEPAPATVAELLEQLRTTYPALRELRSCAVAVNNEYAEANQALSATDEIALIPPVAGG